MDWLRYRCKDCQAKWTMPEVSSDYPDNQECTCCPGCAGKNFKEVVQ